MKTLLIADPGQGGGKSGPSIEDLLKENAQLKERVADLEAKQTKASEREKQIAIKMGHGLSREQAIAVLDRQEAHDASKAKAQPAKAKPTTK